MWKKLVSGLLLVLVIAASGFGLWFYRPWSPYSPAKIAALKDESKLVQTMRSLDDILPFQTLKASPTPRKIQEHYGAPPKFYSWEGSEKQFSDFIEETQTTGLLVLHQGRIKYEKYFLGADETTRFTSWSAAKSFIAVAVLRAIHDGVIESFDDPAEKYAPQFKGSGFGAATIRQLLVMSTGVNFDEDIDDPDSDINRFFFDVLINRSNPDDLLMVYQRDREPMTEFSYISPNSHVLGSILKAAYEKPLNEIIQQNIWTPFGMEGDATWNKHAPNDDGIALAYCCLNARLRDYARFGLQIMDAHVGRPEALDMWPEGFPDAFRAKG